MAVDAVVEVVELASVVFVVTTALVATTVDGYDVVGATPKVVVVVESEVVATVLFECPVVPAVVRLDNICTVVYVLVSATPAVDTSVEAVV